MEKTSCAVLTVHFNRPAKSRGLFSVLQQAQPPRLYVAIDGPRPGSKSDPKLVEDVLEIVSRPEWECEVFVLASAINQGPRSSLVKALDWFFSREDRGIVLEDDCCPQPGFFRFVEDCLATYASDERVMHVSGFRPKRLDDFPAAVSETVFPYVWGWASWARAWHRYSGKLVRASDFRSSREAEMMRTIPGIAERWEALDRNATLRKSGWDYAWAKSIWSHDGTTVMPSVSLVRNVGFDVEGTNTFRQMDYLRASTRTVRRVDSQRLPQLKMRVQALDLSAFLFVYGLRSRLPRVIIRNLGRVAVIRRAILWLLGRRDR